VLRVVRENPLFARLWAAQVVSQAGDWLNRVAVLALIGSLGGREHVVGIGALFGVELALRLLPSALLGPIAGPIADRVPRRLLMVAADVLRALCVTGLYFVREPGHLFWVYALVAAQMGIGIFFDAARTAALPSTVKKGDLHDAYTLSSATWSIMLSIGALTGGVLVDRFGVHNVFLIDASTYIVSALCLAGLILPPVSRHAERLRWRDILLLTDLRRGLEHARSVGIAPMLWAKTFWGAAGGYLVVLALAGHERFGEAAIGDTVGEAALATGMLYAARGVGTGIGPILGRRLIGENDSALKLQTSLGFLVAAVGYAVFGFSHSLLFACVFVAIAHVGGATLWITSTVYWQRHVADEFRGRIFAIEFLGMDIAFAIGGLFAGLLFDATHSLSITVWVVSGCVAVLGAAWTWLARDMKPGVRVPDPISRPGHIPGDEFTP
jgi:predicted MFS family arabinose efflux permease